MRLLVSVRGSVEALAAARGGSHIADVDYPASFLGTPYPLNIMAVRSRLNDAGFDEVLVAIIPLEPAPQNQEHPQAAFSPWQ
jgi:uncharacterized protein (UPF0264 family)